MRPPGLWAGIVVLGVEFLRAREAPWRDLHFIVEWLLMAAVLVVMTMCYWLVLTLFMVPHPGLGIAAPASSRNGAAYPLVVWRRASCSGCARRRRARSTRWGTACDAESLKNRAISSRRITRRALLLGGAQAAFVGGLAWRMRQMQVEQADEFRLLAEENRINMRLIPPARGLIYDRNGAVVAENAQNYRIVIVREDAGDVDATLAKLRRLVAIDEEELERACAR